VTPDEFGRTLLQTAYDRKNFDVIRAILSAEHSSMDWIESSNVEGRTLLSVAVGDDSRDVVASLIAAGAKQTADRDGKTPLHYVKSPAVARMLLEAGAPDVKDNSGYTPLMWLCRIGCDDDTLRLMLDPEYNLDVNAVHFGRTLLTISLINVNMSLFSILCAHPSVDVSMKDARYGETVLHLACSVTEAYVVKILLDAGADPHEEDRFGNTSLNGAYDDSEIVRLLVEAAPEVVYHRNRQNQNVLIYFCSRNCDINVLEDLFVCSDRCNVPIDVNVQDLNGDTALHVAMKHLNDETARLLLFKGADALMSGHEGMTVLMAPFLFDNIEKINDPPDDYNEDEHDGLSDDEGGYYTEEPKMSEEALDLRISHCIKTIVDSFFSRVHPAHQWIITRTGSGAGTKTGTVRHRKWYEPASKRRRK
jgi:ankyrin repeat protein